MQTREEIELTKKQHINKIFELNKKLLILKTEPRKINNQEPSKILDFFNNAFGYDISITNRTSKYLIPRAVICNYLREKKFTLSVIASAMQLHHSTIINSIEKYEHYICSFDKNENIILMQSIDILEKYTIDLHQENQDFNNN